MKAQGYSRDDLVYKSRIQPWAAYYALVASCLLLLVNGYTGAHLSQLWVEKSPELIVLSSQFSFTATGQLKPSSFLTCTCILTTVLIRPKNRDLTCRL